MTRIKYDASLMKTMSVFEGVTRAGLKDCFVDNNGLLVFVVNLTQISKAIGKNAQNVKRLEKMLNRKIKIVEFNPSLIQFVRNLVYPLNVKDVKEEEGVVTITGHDTRTKGLLIGKNSQNIKNYNQIVKRYFDIKDMKVV